MNLPNIKLSPMPDAVRNNRDKINEYIEMAKAELEALRGLHSANQAVCKHPSKRDCYDPGYAGGGFSHHECKDCGKTGYMP